MRCTQTLTYCTCAQVTELEVALADSQAQAQQAAAALTEAQALVGVTKFAKFVVGSFCGTTMAWLGQQQASSRHTVTGLLETWALPSSRLLLAARSPTRMNFCLLLCPAGRCRQGEDARQSGGPGQRDSAPARRGSSIYDHQGHPGGQRCWPAAAAGSCYCGGGGRSSSSSVGRDYSGGRRQQRAEWPAGAGGGAARCAGQRAATAGGPP